MKKLLACGLILSTLMSCGSVCFAGIDNDSETEIDYRYNADEEGGQGYENTKAPRNPRGDKEENTHMMVGDRKELTYLRNKSMFLLHECRFITFPGVPRYNISPTVVRLCARDISELKISYLNDDHTVLTVNGEDLNLPEHVTEVLNEYLAKRSELAPNTMGAEEPLFINLYKMHKLKMDAGSIISAINRYRQDCKRATGVEE